MIEVEKKFLLSKRDMKRLTTGAHFVRERIFTDTYYDSPDLLLGRKDWWLRSREGTFELKIPLHDGPDRLADQYEEMDNESTIRKALELPQNGSLRGDIAKKGYIPFCVCTTTRQTYRKDGFTIDLDAVEYGDFTYAIGEIELMVKNETQAQHATQKIIVFARQHDLPIALVRGKVVEYLKKKRPEHYHTLIQAGVLKDT